MLNLKMILILSSLSVCVGWADKNSGADLLETTSVQESKSEPEEYVNPSGTPKSEFYRVTALWDLVDELKDREDIKLEWGYKTYDLPTPGSDKTQEADALEMTVETLTDDHRYKQTYTYFVDHEKSTGRTIYWQLKWLSRGESCIRRNIDLEEGNFTWDNFFIKPNPDLDPDTEAESRTLTREYCEPKGLDHNPYDISVIRMMIKEIRN